MLTKKLKTALVATAGAGAVFVGLGAGPAAAGPTFTPDGPIWGQFSGVEQFVPGGTTFPASSGATGCDGLPASCNPVGLEQNWGVGTVNAIYTGAVAPGSDHIEITGPNAPTIFAFGGGPTITFMFSRIGDTTVNPDGSVKSKGGILDIYWWDSGNTVSQSTLDAQGAGGRAPTVAGLDQYRNITCGVSATIIGATGCQLLVQLNFVPGAAVTGGGAVDPSVTITGTNNPATALSRGFATFYTEVDLDTTPGSCGLAGGCASAPWAKALASQWFTKSTSPGNPTLGPEFADMLFNNTYLRCSAGGSGSCPGWGGAGGPGDPVGLNFNDPVQAFGQVPEPMSLSLFGFGLLGLGYLTRRKARAIA